jgi:hypothetical protein
MVSRQQREAKLALKATRLAKQKKRVKKQVRLAALANAAPEIPLVLTAANPLPQGTSRIMTFGNPRLKTKEISLTPRAPMNLLSATTLTILNPKP